VHYTTDDYVSEDMARYLDTVDHCAAEERMFEHVGSRPPPWLSYCQNPRPHRRGFWTGEMIAEENERLKTEWEEKHGKTPLRDSSN